MNEKPVVERQQPFQNYTVLDREMIKANRGGVKVFVTLLVPVIDGVKEGTVHECEVVSVDRYAVKFKFPDGICRWVGKQFIVTTEIPVT